MRQRRPSQRAGFAAWIRLLAAFAAALVAADHSLASLHQALSAHQVCAEHGELVHGGEHHRVTTAADPHAAITPVATGEDDHHHCGVVPATPMRSRAVAAPSTCPAATLLRLEVCDPPAMRRAAADVLAFAPKQSPPV